MKKLKTIKASVLVFSLIILFIGLAAAIGIASSTLTSQKNSLNTASSVQSFQVADSGAEIFLGKLKDADSNATLGSLFNCTGGVIKGDIGTGRDYTVTAYAIGSTTPIADCNANLSQVDRIKSIGSYKNTARAVEMAVAAGGGCKWVNIDSGGTQIGQYVVYTGGSDNSPEKMCINAGYTSYSGACKTQKIGFSGDPCGSTADGTEIQGSVLSNNSISGGNWGISCIYGNVCFSLNPDPAKSQILCCK
jgi:hypothetical protein